MYCRCLASDLDFCLCFFFDLHCGSSDPCSFHFLSALVIGTVRRSLGSERDRSCHWACLNISVQCLNNIGITTGSKTNRRRTTSSERVCVAFHRAGTFSNFCLSNCTVFFPQDPQFSTVLAPHFVSWRTIRRKSDFGRRGSAHARDEGGFDSTRKLQGSRQRARRLVAM